MKTLEKTFLKTLHETLASEQTLEPRETALVMVKARMQEVEQIEACVCGDPGALNVVHRRDEPCYIAPDLQRVETDNKVFVAQVLNPRCPCGEQVGELVKYVQKSDHTITTMLGFCKCGNIFIGWRPKQSTP